MEGFRTERANVFSVQPAQLIDGESRVGFVDAIHVESLDQVFHQEKFALVSRIPPEKGDIIDNRLRQETHPHQVFKGWIPCACSSWHHPRG